MTKSLLILFLLATMACSVQSRIADRILQAELEAAYGGGNRRNLRSGSNQQQERKLTWAERQATYQGTPTVLKVYDAKDDTVVTVDPVNRQVGTTRQNTNETDSVVRVYTSGDEYGMIEVIDARTRSASGQCLQEYEDRRRNLGGVRGNPRRDLKKYGGLIRTVDCDVDDEDQRWTTSVVMGTSTHMYTIQSNHNNNVMYYDSKTLEMKTWPVDRANTAEDEDTWIQLYEPRKTMDLIDCDEDSLDSDEEDLCGL